ncbi:alpha/beta hydrolase [Leifsonia shinshuensis]|uniref:alpha/beta fold hydrolase n=1 Tax=Leifsonia shinshuensis TaxID=150026 RepID=UPI00285558F7|nr:alpha/beta hydrolase [Leifsonia shinshuensis]MDR6972098.1 haloacetate dehalogenase [Leifsonia shinshuensis]
MFDGFETADVDVGAVRLRVRQGGEGRPIVLLHGHPRTGATWHRVAPLLVERGFRVVVPDLRGYGRSTAPPPQPDHAQASKRAMAGDVLALMRSLGHERFDVVGHDRGSYVAFRLAMDHPEAVRRAAVLDCIPIVEHLDRITPEFATAWYHWFFFAQPETPERVITADPDAWYHGDPDAMGRENFDERREAIHRPEVVHAMLEDYRAGLTVDRADEEADRAAGRRVTVPLLALWSLRDDLEELFGDPLAIWQDWAVDVRGAGIDSGHHVAEEAPGPLVDALGAFFLED